jgi:hypothetical protein
MVSLHPHTPLGPRQFDVAVLGFSRFERAAQLATFRMSDSTPISFRAVDDIGAADFLVVDTEDAAAVRSIVAPGRVHEAIFVGNGAPDEAMCWIHRPIDVRRLLRGLTAMVEDDDEEIATSRASTFAPLSIY